MELIKLLRRVEIFTGLTEEQLAKLASVFEERTLQKDEVLFLQGDIGDALYLVQEGFVVVILESSGRSSGRTLIQLGPGQSVGEMALVDRGPRSATVRAVADGTRVARISFEAFEALCEEEPEIGYRVMRNIAADLSFKLRHQHLQNQ